VEFYLGGYSRCGDNLDGNKLQANSFSKKVAYCIYLFSKPEDPIDPVRSVAR
jgi:hypothetical protein